MRTVIFLSAAVAGLGLLVSSVASSALGPGGAAIADAGGARASSVPRPRFRNHQPPAPTPCSSNFPTNSFNAIHGVEDHAGGDDSAVLAGTANEACDESTSVSGGDYNVIGLGATDSFIGGGYLNAVSGVQAGITAGEENNVAAYDAGVGAGYKNYVYGGGTDSFIAGGLANTIADGSYSFIAAGDTNSVSAKEAFIGSGQDNNIAAAATSSVIAGGSSNTAGNADAAVGGGSDNNATGAAAVVGGGADNTAQGSYATIPGGYLNAADGSGSFAAGTLAKARTNGAFVWSDDSTNTELQSTANYQFLARAAGGFYLYSNSAATLGVKLSPNSGTWASASDRNMKSDVVPLDDAAVLAKVAALPITEWSYRSEGGIRHVGPMAQDFYAAFRVGEDDRHITSIDEDGVALAAIKALHAENASLHSENVVLRGRLAALEQKVGALLRAR